MFTIRKTAKTVLLAMSALVVGYFLLIAYLLNQDEPVFAPSPQQAMSAQVIDDLGFEQVYESTPMFFKTRNDSKIAAQYFPQDSNVTVLVLHGILSSSYTNNRFSGLIRESVNANVYALDLRGHGRSDGKPGDVDYIGQYVDDVADVVAKIKAANPNDKIIIAGHSMGGGISLRYALRDNVPNVDGYLLFAPQLGDNSPTNVRPETSTSETENSFMAIHWPRVIGLALLNSLNISQWNDLPVFFFNLPAGSPVTTYTFRSSASMAPTDYVAGLQAIDKPLLVVIGENDEAFNAPVYKDIITTYTNGEFKMVSGQTHNGIRHSDVAMNHVRDWTDIHNFFASDGE